MDTRPRILKAALKLLRKDPGAVRMEDVARAAHVSRQAVYLHFPNRTALLEAATAHVEQELGFLERLKPIQEAKSGVLALERMVEFLGDYLPAAQPIIEAFTPGRSSDPAVQAIFKTRAEDRRRGVKMMIGWLIRDKALAKGLDPATAEELILGLTSFELWREMVVVGKLSNADYVVQLKRLLRRAILKADARQG
jgi:AcrR family transcriptional regulator